MRRVTLMLVVAHSDTSSRLQAGRWTRPIPMPVALGKLPNARQGLQLLFRRHAVPSSRVEGGNLLWRFRITGRDFAKAV
jgi:hypothetical protein